MKAAVRTDSVVTQILDQYPFVIAAIGLTRSGTAR
jgi:hypothetical protein